MEKYVHVLLAQHLKKRLAQCRSTLLHRSAELKARFEPALRVSGVVRAQHFCGCRG